MDSPVLSDGIGTYDWGANENALVSEVRGGLSFFYHADSQGNTVHTDQHDGTASAHFNYDAFGNSTGGMHAYIFGNAAANTPSPFGYVGQGGYQGDADTGLMLCGHRYYDSSTGRFLSRDPARAGDNWYTYCGNDPIDCDDSQGLTISWDGPGWNWSILNPLLGRIKSITLGGQMIDDMKNSRIAYHIVITTGDPHYDPNAHTVYLHPGLAYNITTDKDHHISNQAVQFDLLHQIAHEFGHAWTGESDEDNGHSGDHMNMVEKTENPICLPLTGYKRVDYWYWEGGRPYAPRE